jgi:hypothetical protein
LYIRHLIPYSTIGNKWFRFHNFSQPQYVRIKIPGFFFLSYGNTNLNMIEAPECIVPLDYSVRSAVTGLARADFQIS